MEDGLVPCYVNETAIAFHVLILVVMEDGLVLSMTQLKSCLQLCLNPCCNGRWSSTGDRILLCSIWSSLNPCCNGRWSSTRPYKTILIINKLKNSAKQFFTFLNRKLTFP